MLDLPAPKLRAYRPETSIAEKFETIVSRGLLNSRLKDYFDIYVLSLNESFDLTNQEGQEPGCCGNQLDFQCLRR